MAPYKNIQLSKYDEIFTGMGIAPDETVTELPITELHTFQNHPFKVKDDEKMQETVDSIRIHGVLVPLLVRPRREGGYEIISGHRRKHACELLGLENAPAIIRNLSNDDAAILMVDSNIQREHLDPSEKAFAYRMKMEHLNHRGRKSGSLSADEIGTEGGDSKRQIFRYIRLTELIPELLQAVDGRKLGFNCGVELSYLSRDQQKVILQVIEENVRYPNLSQVRSLREASLKGQLTKEKIREVLELKAKPQRSLDHDRIRSYFPKGTSDQVMTDLICQLLEEWKKGGGRL